MATVNFIAAIYTYTVRRDSMAPHFRSQKHNYIINYNYEKKIAVN